VNLLRLFNPLTLVIYRGFRARRATFPSASTSSLTINEPTKDLKGKKRAEPEADSEEEGANLALSSSSKRTRTASYSLRSRTGPSSSISAPMPKKSKYA
jgi:E3 ubiquitin-protein ligase TRIP12